MESSYQFSPIDDSKDKIFDATFEKFYNLFKNSHGRNVRFIGNINGRYIKYEAEKVKSDEEYIVRRKYSKNNIYHGDIEELDIFPTEEMNTYFGWERHMIPVSLEVIYEKLKPVYKQRYLANGREYKKEWEFNE